MIYIIGSGLSGMAAAVALSQRGYVPTVLDAGLDLDEARRVLKMRLASLEPEQWNAADVARLKQVGPAAASGIPRKLHFGSAFAYRDADPATSIEVSRASMYRSFALGGFSSVWGAVIQPFPNEEIRRWPVDPGDLVPHYAAMRALLSDGTVQPTTQARAFYADLDKHREELSARGIRFRYADLAVRATDRNGTKGCRYCGLCLYGCPYESIHTAASTLARFRCEGRVRYIPGVIVDKLSPAVDRVRIEARLLADGARICFDDPSVVFVAAGVLESARIILTSLALSEIPVQLRHSDIFTLPLLRFPTANGIARERIHTLCQLILDFDDDAVDVNPVRLQLYGYNDLYAPLLARKVGPFSTPLAPLLDSLSTHLWTAFGYVHSDASSSVRMTLTGGSPVKLRVEGEHNPKARQIARAVARRLMNARRFFRAIPVSSGLRFDLPGGGYHTGGSFPMSATPGPLETDRWGRLASLPRIHLVDASLLPSVPAGTLAFTVMANAHRIALECPLPVDV
jgi:choline dehydrogenase-like flavoprotein